MRAIHIYNFLIQNIKSIASKEYRELTRIKKLPRYTSFVTSIVGRSTTGVDGASFVFTYNEIFKKEIYRFIAKNKSPYIIDCGANIGLSVLYFKKLYPSSQIIAFEADKEIYETLCQNINSFSCRDVDLQNKAVWFEETSIDFFSEGADGGRVISAHEEQKNKYKIKTIRLREYLINKKVDFLKIDIEGAETIVLRDCADVLNNVENLFIEYHSFEGQEQTLHELFLILHNAHFRIHALPVAHSPQPFIKQQSYLGIDMQFNIFAFRK